MVAGKLHLAPSLLETDNSGENLREIGQRTEGYSGADLQAVVYNAQLEAIHDVLGDIELSDPNKGGDAKQGGSGSKAGKDKGIPDFSHFRYGDPVASPADPGKPIPSSQLTERAMIAQKIAALQTLRRKQKQLQRPNSSHNDDERDGQADDDSNERKDPEIQWKHIESALTTGRSSISAQDRVRLERIYREFVDGRDGNLPNGQGGTEIGGRSSLM